MAKYSSKWLALAGILAIGASSVFAQDSKALIDILIKKGILTPEDAAQIAAEARQAASQSAATPAVPQGAPTSASTTTSASIPMNTPTSSTTVTGKLYVDVSYLDAETASGTKLAAGGTGIDVKRFYLGATHVFNSMWLANINTDSSYFSATGATNVYIKTAYVQAKFSPEAIVQVGAANEPWIPWDEDLYTYRYVEKTIVDRLAFGNSADWGVHFLGTSGIVSYNFAAVNGGGYKNPTRSKDMDFEGRLSVEPVKGLTLAVGGYDGKLGKDLYGTPNTRTANRFDALVNYATPQYALGAEYFSESNWGFTNSASKDSSDGFSVFGKVKVGDPFWLFARWDQDKPGRNLHPTLEENYFNCGWEYVATKGVNLSLVYKYDKLTNPSSASQAAKTQELGMFAQIAF
jgi:hypothetical protein